MKTAILPLILVATLPLAAQERYQVGVSYDQQSPKSQTYSPFTLHPEKNAALGLTFAWTGWTFGNSDLGLMAAYRFKAKSDFTVESPYGTEKTADFTSEHFAVGAQYVWRRAVDFGIGLQVRFEKQAVEPSDHFFETISVNQVRPWLSATAGHTFKTTGSTKPFVALSLALPLTSESKPAPNPPNTDSKANDEQLVKSMAPDFEIAVQVGLRF